MGYGKSPKGGIRWVSEGIVKACYLIIERSVFIQIIRQVIAVGIQGIHDIVIVGIQELNYHAVVGRHPDTPVAVIVSYRGNFAHIKTQEIIDPGDDRLFKTDPPGSVHTKFNTIGIS